MKDQDNLRRLRREWYHRNRAVEAEKQRLRRIERRIKVQAYIIFVKESNPCTDCNQYYSHYQMDFDHLGDKEFTIARHGGSKSLDTVKAEIEKCEIVCANCHRQRTWERLHGGGVTET